MNMHFSYNLTIIMLWVDALLYALLTAYLEQVCPRVFSSHHDLLSASHRSPRPPVQPSLSTSRKNSGFLSQSPF
jgi:hypothetical protein